MTGNTDLEVKFAPKQREMLQKCRVSLKISWEPVSLVPGEYPTLVFASNFSLLGHPLLIYFGEGCCSCSSCDRGKTKSTLSLKT